MFIHLIFLAFPLVLLLLLPLFTFHSEEERGKELHYRMRGH